MSTQDSNTKKIAYGELHFYYPFKFDNLFSILVIIVSFFIIFAVFLHATPVLALKFKLF